MIVDPLTEGLSLKIFSNHIEWMGIKVHHYWYNVMTL